MALTNNIKTQVDLPVWEWLRFAPTATSAVSGTCIGEGTDTRFIYYLVSASFYRYDTVTDSWQTLASPNITPTVRVSLKYVPFSGSRGRVISATATTATIGIAAGNTMLNETVRIMSGTGMGQDRTITAVDEPVIYDHGFCSVASATTVGDGTKKWKYNQWSGYMCRLVYGTGSSQFRRVLYNDTTTLYFSDANYQQIDPWNNTGFSAIAPYAVPVNTAATPTNFYIEASTVTVATWDVTPDYTSRFATTSGGIYLMGGFGSSPFGTLQYYDVAADTWSTRTFPVGIWTAAPATDLTFEKVGEYAGYFENGTASAGTATTLTDGTKTWTADRWRNYQLRIMSGTGMGNRFRIVGNTGTVLYLDHSHGVTLDNTSVYRIYGDTNTAYLSGNGVSAVWQYVTDCDNWTQGSLLDFGTNAANGLCTKLAGSECIPSTGFTRNTNTITGINTTPVAKGTNYVVGDILTLATGVGGKVIVEAISAGGLVETVSLLSPGSSGYSVATFATSGGTGSGCTISVTSVGVSARVVTTANHFYKIGDTVTLSGATDATYNTTYTITGVDALTQFDVTTTAAATAVAVATSSVTVIVDASKSWAVNSLVGMLIQTQTAGTGGTIQVRRISSNTANSVTVNLAITAPTNTTRFLIHDTPAFGRAVQYKVPAKTNTGWATGGSTTTLVDSGKNWNVNQWASYRIQIEAGTGAGSEFAITSNTATTLTYATQSFTPDATTKYRIMDTWGLSTAGSTTTLTDTTKNWATNMWAGKRLRMMSGTGQNLEYVIASNTATVITFALGTSPSTDTNYTILDVPTHGAGIEFVWLHSPTATAKKGREIWRARGGASNVFDVYDIPTETWKLAWVTTPQTETLTTGSMYTYDGADSLLFTKDATGRIYQLRLDVGRIRPCGTVPYGMSTAIIGNRMEIITTTDGLKYLYVMRHTATEMWRTLVFWT